MARTLDAFRTGHAYTIAEAARYARTTSTTVRRWLYGDPDPARAMAPVFGDKVVDEGQHLDLSFLDLAEISVAVRFTKRGGRLDKVRAARRRALHDYPELPYPFASLRLRQIGGEILHLVDADMGGKPLAQAISLGGLEGEQHVLPAFVEEALDLFEFDQQDTMATRWYPAGKHVPLVIDPRVAGGRLTVLGRGVTVETIRRRVIDAEEDWDFVADDLEIDLKVIHAAVSFSSRPAA